MNHIKINELCLQRINEMKSKASHNKLEALLSFRIIMICTLSAPLFVAFGNEVLYAKIIPSILSVLAAFATGWIQLRKPQSLWGLYRNAQRELESELYSYMFDIEPYDGGDKDKLLYIRTSAHFESTHKQWLNLIPTYESFSKSDVTSKKINGED